MPKQLHDKLEREASAKGLRGERKDAYVYGTLNKVEEKNKEHQAENYSVWKGTGKDRRPQTVCKKCGKPIHYVNGKGWTH